MLVQATALAYSARGFGASGTHSLLIGTEMGVLLSMHPTSGSVRLVCNLAGIIPCGEGSGLWQGWCTGAKGICWVN